MAPHYSIPSLVDEEGRIQALRTRTMPRHRKRLHLPMPREADATATTGGLAPAADANYHEDGSEQPRLPASRSVRPRPLRAGPAMNQVVVVTVASSQGTVIAAADAEPSEEPEARCRLGICRVWWSPESRAQSSAPRRLLFDSHTKLLLFSETLQFITVPCAFVAPPRGAVQQP